MVSEIDLAMLELSLAEDEVPFSLPDRPEFYSNEKNKLSIIGRALNPKAIKITDLVLDMPRKWQKHDRVYGKPLSKERFQFFFKSEHDLQEILEKGFHTYNEWGLAMERWVESPPADFLHFQPVWVQIRNVPVNHFTEVAIETMGALVGTVMKVAFDDTKPYTLDYVRVRVKLDVRKPLKKSRTFQLPKGGGDWTLYFDYERVQKRCYSCQMLTHDQSGCPLKMIKREEIKKKAEQKHQNDKMQEESVLAPDDPLYGVLKNNQVGLDPLNGRPRIAEEVLTEMRRYLLTDTQEDLRVKEDKLKLTVALVEKDPLEKQTMLRLEPAPQVTRDLNKGKGLVYQYDEKNNLMAIGNSMTNISQPKLMASAIESGRNGLWEMDIDQMTAVRTFSSNGNNKEIYHFGSTVYGSCLTQTGPSGSKVKRQIQRKRPPKHIRAAAQSKRNESNGMTSKDYESLKTEDNKRKVKKEETGPRKKNKAKQKEAVPNGGQPNI